MNQKDDDSSPIERRSMGSFNYRFGNTDNSRSIGSRTKPSSFRKKASKSIAIDSELSEKYDDGSGNSRRKKKKRKGSKRKRKKKRKGAKDSQDDIIPNSLYSDQPLVRDQEDDFHHHPSSDEDDDLYGNMNSRYGDDYGMGGSKKKSKLQITGAPRRGGGFVSTPRDKVGNEVDLSMRLSNSIDESRDVITSSTRNTLGMSDLGDLGEDPVMDNIEDDDEDDDVDISFVDLTGDKVNLEKNRDSFFGSSDDDISGSIRSNFGGFGSNMMPATSTSSKKKQVFRHGTLIDVDETDESNEKTNKPLDTTNINRESIHDTSVDYINPHSPTETKSEASKEITDIKLLGSSSSFPSQKDEKSKEEIEKLKSDIEKQRIENESQQQKINEFESKIQKLEEEKEELREEKNDVLEQHSETMEQLANIQTEMEEKENSMMSFQSTISDLNQQKQELEELVEEEKREKLSILKKYEELQKDMKLKESEEIKQPEPKEEEEKVVTFTDEELISLRKELSDEREMRMELMESNKELKEKHELEEGKRNRLEIVTQEKEEKIQALENENELLQNDVQELKEKEKELKDQHRRKLMESESGHEIKNLEKMLQATQEDNQKVQEKLKEYQNREKENQTKDSAEIRTLKTTNNELQETIDRLESEKRKFSEYSVRLTRLEQERDTIARTYEEDKLMWGKEKKHFKEKIEWWTKNQDLISEKEKQVIDLEEEVRRIKSSGTGNNPEMMDELIRENEKLKKKLSDPTRLSQIIKRTVKEQNEESSEEVESLKQEVINIKSSAAQSMRSLRQEFEKTKVQYEKRIEDLKKKVKKASSSSSTTTINSGKSGGYTRKKMLMERKKYEEQINEKNQTIEKLTRESESFKLRSRNSSKKVTQMEKKLNRIREEKKKLRENKEEVLKITQKYEDQLFRLEKDHQRITEELKLEHQKKLIEKENEVKNLPYDEKSRRLMIQVEMLMNKLAGFESSQRVMKMKHAQQIEELKAKFEVEYSKLRLEFNKILKNKNAQVKRFKMSLDQIMEDISRYKKVKDFEISQISMIQKQKSGSVI